MPHSEIPGSKPVRGSPRLIAAYHVLHRLSAPRHPPNTLKALDRSHYQHPPLGRVTRLAPCAGVIRKTICFKHIRGHCGQANPRWSLVVQSLAARKNDRICFLFTMTDSTHQPLRRKCEFGFSKDASSPKAAPAAQKPRQQSANLVEPDGIEPTTSCLQSTRSPN